MTPGGWPAIHLAQARRGMHSTPPLGRRRRRVDPPIQSLIQRANRDPENQAQRIIAHCLELLPHYRGLPGPVIESVRENVLHHLGLFFRVTLKTGRPLTSEDLESSRSHARLRASQGVPLAEFLSFYQIGNMIIWDDLLAGAEGNELKRARLLEMIPIIISNQTQVTTAVTEAYVQERESLSHFRERDLDDFFQQLLSDDALEGLLEIRAKALGVCPDETNTLVLFRPALFPDGDTAGPSPENLRRLISDRMKTSEALVGRCREGFVALLQGEPEPDALGVVARSLFGESGRVGIGNPGQAISGLIRSAREAVRALEIGSALNRAAPVHRYADLAILDLVRVGSQDAEAFVRSVLGTLALPGPNRSSLETLRQLVRKGFRMKQAAAALAIHPNTLAYRLKQIRDRFGIDLEDSDTRLKVHLALIILESSRASLSS